MVALERGINPSQLEGGFAWTALIPLIPLLKPLLKPVEKAVDRGSDWLLDKIGLPKGSGFAPTGAVHVNTRSLPSDIHETFAMPTQTGKGVVDIPTRELDALKAKLIPNIHSPDALGVKLTRLAEKAKQLSKGGKKIS